MFRSIKLQKLLKHLGFSLPMRLLIDTVTKTCTLQCTQTLNLKHTITMIIAFVAESV